MKKTFLFCVLYSSGFSGQFCVATSFGKDCWYADANVCRAEALKSGGMCIYEDQNLPQVHQPSPPPPQQFVDPYLVNPPPPQKFYGMRFNEAYEAGIRATSPIGKILQQDQENKRAEAEHQLELEKQRTEIELLKQQEEYYRSLLKNNEVKQTQPTTKINYDSLLKALPDKKLDSLP